MDDLLHGEVDNNQFVNIQKLESDLCTTHTIIII